MGTTPHATSLIPHTQLAVHEVDGWIWRWTAQVHYLGCTARLSGYAGDLTSALSMAEAWQRNAIQEILKSHERRTVYDLRATSIAPPQHRTRLRLHARKSPENPNNQRPPCPQ